MRALDYFAARLPDYLDELRALVAIDTRTGDAAGGERAAAFLADRFAALGTMERDAVPGFGPLLRVLRPGRGARILLLAHYDTVWDAGSWPEPWQERAGRVFGPGVYDMKAGLLFTLWMLRWLDHSGTEHPTLEILLTPDEEVGSPGSRERIHAAAGLADAVLVLEPASPDGHLKLERKGSGEYAVDITGRSAHQGVAPEQGVNAIVEAAHQVLRMLQLEDRAAGTTVGPNVLRGGSASNTVAERARILVDVRAWSVSESHRIDAGLRALAPVLEGARIEVDGRWNRPPMEASPASIALFERARAIGSDLGLTLERVAWGGSSDANLTAALGVPTIDGLGPIGDGAHQPSEHVLVSELPRRMALLAELVTSLARPPAL